MANPFEGYKITSPYGWRRLGSSSKFHAGIDLVKSHKAPIFAFTDGVVLYAGMGKSGTGLGNYGNVVVVEDKNGRAQLYAHLNSIAVRKGAKIKKGQTIGYQGATGNVTGSHLHYEVRKKSAPLFGWESNSANSTLEPTAYLQTFQQVDQAKSVQHTVKAGDTLYSIAKKYHTSVDSIKAANHIGNDNLIQVNQVLQIPSASSPVYYTVKPGDTLYGISQKYHTSEDNIRKANNIKGNLIQIGQVLRIPNANSPIFYQVKKGDNLTHIAEAYNTTVEELASMNKIKNVNLLQIGQILRVK